MVTVCRSLACARARLSLGLCAFVFLVCACLSSGLRLLANRNGLVDGRAPWY